MKLDNIKVPKGKIDLVLDTDTYNEIDDQYALIYLLRSPEKLNLKAIYAAPFFNERSTSPEDGMERSYEEILRLLNLSGNTDYIEKTFKGSKTYLPDETTPVNSDAAEHLVKLAANYSEENPLYVVAIGAITNVASALLMEPSIADKIVVVWLGGHGEHFHHTEEFNMRQDVAAARVVFSKAPVVQLPCMGVVSAFAFSPMELEHYLRGKGELAEYLLDITLQHMEEHPHPPVYSKAIWDVTAVAWLLNDNDRFMLWNHRPQLMPQYDHHYSVKTDKLMTYVYHINRDELASDLFEKVTR